MGFQDSLLAFAAKVYFNTLIRDFGMINDLSFSSHPDGKSKNVSVNISLKGEPEPIQIFVAGVKIIRRGDKRFISIQSVASTTPSKAWLAPFLATFKIFPHEIPVDNDLAEKLTYLIPEEASVAGSAIAVKTVGEVTSTI
jgi:hypothetical protein